MKCEDCGKIDVTVSVTNCPFTEEIYNEIVEAILCEKCYEQRCLDT